MTYHSYLIESNMNGSFPQMPIEKASKQIEVLNDYMDLTDRFIAATIKFDEFSNIATEKGFAAAEAALAMASDHLNSRIITSKSIVRIDISTILLVVACNRVDQRQTIEKRIKGVIDSAISGGAKARSSYALYPDDGTCSDTLLHRMKVTMPAAWSIESQSVMVNGVDFKKEIENGNIQTYVQGVYYKDRSLRGVELLARWKADDVGVVSPSVFLDGIRTQQVSAIFLKLLLKKALEVQQNFSKLGQDELIVSININPLDLMAEAIINELTTFASIHDATSIELELVETDDFDKLVGFNQVMKHLSSLGYRLAIDDFGSRYAWINSLGEYVTTIKLDQSFTQRLAKGDNANKAELVVSSVVNMAKSMNLEVIAEGIEDKNDFDVMASKGVAAFQGYFYGAPVNLDEFLKNFRLEEENKEVFKDILVSPEIPIEKKCH